MKMLEVRLSEDDVSRLKQLVYAEPGLKERFERAVEKAERQANVKWTTK